MRPMPYVARDMHYISQMCTYVYPMPYVACDMYACLMNIVSAHSNVGLCLRPLSSDASDVYKTAVSPMTCIPQTTWQQCDSNTAPTSQIKYTVTVQLQVFK